MQTNTLDELRNTLVNRAMPVSPQPTPAPVAPMGAAPAPAAPMVPRNGLQPGGQAPAPAQTTDPISTGMKPSLLTTLADAAAGGSGAAPGPQTGMTPPSWPGTPAPMGPGDLPVGKPNTTPPQARREDTANKMIDGYQNGWSPNPMLIRMMENR